MSSLSYSYIFTSSFIYFKKYTIKLNSRNTIFGYSSYEIFSGVAVLVPGVQVAKAQALELTVVVPRETTSGR